MINVSKYTSTKFRIHLSSVVTPDNISDLYEVYEFSKSNDFYYAVAPHLEGVVANKKLHDNHEYKAFYDFLIQQKLKGGKIFGSVRYLTYMRDLRKFDCRPFTMLVIAPTGEIFYPCLEIGNLTSNILVENDLHKVKRNAEKLFGNPPQCGNQCHSACALSFALLLNDPISEYKEFI